MTHFHVLFVPFLVPFSGLHFRTLFLHICFAHTICARRQANREESDLKYLRVLHAYCAWFPPALRTQLRPSLDYAFVPFFMIYVFMSQTSKLCHTRGMFHLFTHARLGSPSATTTKGAIVT